MGTHQRRGFLIASWFRAFPPARLKPGEQLCGVGPVKSGHAGLRRRLRRQQEAIYRGDGEQGHRMS